MGMAGWAVAHVFDPKAAISIGGDIFYGAYLVLIAVTQLRATPDDMRKKAANDDEGMIFIAIITSVALYLTVSSIFELLNAQLKPNLLHLLLALGSAPLAWFVLHTNAAFHYAHAYYGDPDGPCRGRTETGGLRFPATAEPGPWEFIYFAFVIGMTAQVSDVQVESTWMRQRTVLHGVVSFFFNTVLIAMAVNVVVAIFQSH
jgi:uncharacterized membrane protein